MSHFDRRIYLGIMLFIVGFLPIGAGSFFALNNLVSEQRDLVSTSLQQLNLAERLRFLNSSRSSLMPVYVLSGEDRVLKSLDERNTEFEQALIELRAEKIKPEVQSLLTKIEQLAQRARAVSLKGIELKQKGRAITEVNQYFVEHSRDMSRELSQSLTQLLNEEKASLLQAQAEVARSFRWGLGSLIVFFGFAVVLGAIACRLLLQVLRERRLHDETQKNLIAAEKQMAQARKEAVEVVAHDLKNPLGTIRMSVEMALEQISPAQLDLQKVLQITQRSATSMENLIGDLLDHAKIESGRLELELRSGDLLQLVHDLAERFRPHADRKNIALLVEVGERSFPVKCDYRRMEQVVSNLIGNAIKFTGAHGRVVLQLTSTENEVVLCVQDSGLGLSEEQAVHIFERFWQVRQTAKQGTGLGLAISKAIVDAHNGRIWVESVPGRGSFFFVSLPLTISTKASRASVMLSYN